jgi:hypothetical protein
VTDAPQGTPGPDGSADNADARSEQACPRCGQHRLALLDLPEVEATGYRPLDEALGMGEQPTLEEPGIGCLNCGAEWPNIEAFQAEAKRH